MPALSNRRSRQQGGDLKTFEAAREGLLDGIARVEQRAARTNLADPIELALDILGGVERASSRTLIIASDFVNDVDRQHISIEPPTATAMLRPIAFRVDLVVAAAQGRDLAKLKLSASEHFHEVRDAWSKYFSGVGATRVTVQLLSAVVLPAETR